MVVLVTCKNEEDPIQNDGVKMVTILKCARTANSIIGDRILKKVKLIQVFMVVLLSCKNEEDTFQIESTRVVTTFFPL